MCIPVDIHLPEFSIPVQIQNDCDYYQVLSDILGEYYEHISQIRELGCETIQCIRKNIEDIENAVEKYLKNHIDEAKNLIKSLIERYADEKFFVSEFNDSYAFRGISTQEDQQKTFGRDKTHKEHYQEMQEAHISLFRGRIFEHGCTSIGKPTAEDMLHIPFNLREKVATERYSMAGIPCFHLATTTLGCYLELNKPSFDEFYVSSYTVNNNNNIKLLNLYITEMQINSAGNGYFNNDEIRYLQNLVSIFPLVIASSFVVEDVEDKAKRSFKTEYIIPQLIMMAINELEIDGVAYLSVHMSNRYAYPQCVNIAIPMIQNNPSDKYSDQLQYFTLTEPICFSECLNLVNNDHTPTESHVKQFYSTSSDNDDHYFEITKDNGGYSPYVDGNFEHADDIILARPHIPCPI